MTFSGSTMVRRRRVFVAFGGNRSRSTIRSAAVRIAAAHALPQAYKVDHSLPWRLGSSIRAMTPSSKVSAV